MDNGFGKHSYKYEPKMTKTGPPMTTNEPQMTKNDPLGPSQNGPYQKGSKMALFWKLVGFPLLFPFKPLSKEL